MPCLMIDDEEVSLKGYQQCCDSHLKYSVGIYFFVFNISLGGLCCVELCI